MKKLIICLGLGILATWLLFFVGTTLKGESNENQEYESSYIEDPVLSRAADCIDCSVVKSNLSRIDGYNREDGEFVPVEIVVENIYENGDTTYCKTPIHLTEIKIREFNKLHPEYHRERK